MLDTLGQPIVTDCLRRDLYLLCYQHRSMAKRVVTALTNRGFHAVMLYRLSNWCWRHHIPLVPLVLTRAAQMVCAIDIAYQATLGPGIVIVHGFGVVIGSETRIEGDCRIFHGVTFGDRGSEWIGSPMPDGHPRVAKNCIFGAGAKILGPVRIGRNSVIGANAVVTKDVPECSIVAGNPARIVGRRPEMTDQLCRVEPWSQEEFDTVMRSRDGIATDASRKTTN